MFTYKTPIRITRNSVGPTSFGIRIAKKERGRRRRDEVDGVEK